MRLWGTRRGWDIIIIQEGVDPMDKIIFATANEGKMREIREIFKDAPYSVVSMKEAGITADIVEDGTTFEEMH